MNASHPLVRAAALVALVLAGPPATAGDVLYTVLPTSTGRFATSPEHSFGFWTISLDDVDGDGARDFAVGAPAASAAAGSLGEIHVVSGATGARLHTILGGGTVGYVGYGLFEAADRDGDGLRDIGTLSGAGFAVFSSVTGALLSTSSVGIPSSSLFQSLAPVGDVDGDGVLDALLGDPEWTPNAATQTTQVHGNGRAELVSGADGSTIRAMDPAVGSGFGRMVAALGDVDGDLVPDYGIVGGSESFAGGYEGLVARFHVVSGATGARLHSLEVRGVELHSNQVARVGDLDGDGRGDLVFAGKESVRAFSTATWDVLHEVELEHVLRGPVPVTASVGDADGDGVDDVAVAVSSGSVGVLTVLSGADGGRLTTYPLEFQPFSVGGLGDVDGDGVPEVWVGHAGRVEVRSALERLTAPVSYCTGSAFTGGNSRHLRTAGSTSLSAGDLTFHGLNNHRGLVLLLAAPERDLDWSPFWSPWSALCLGGPLRRVAGVRQDVDGSWSTTPDLSWLRPHGLVPGTTWSFQAFVLVSNGRLTNSTNAVRVPFAP